MIALAYEPDPARRPRAASRSSCGSRTWPRTTAVRDADNDTINVHATLRRAGVSQHVRRMSRSAAGPNFNEADMSRQAGAATGRRSPVDPAYATELWQQRQEALQSVDEAVARIVAQLRATR